MFDPEDIRLMTNREWRLHCPQVTLADKTGQQVAHGHGELDNLTPGTISVRLFIDKRETGVADSTQERLPPDLMIECIDSRGRRWFGRDFWLKFRGSSGSSDFERIELRGSEIDWEEFRNEGKGPDVTDGFGQFSYLFFHEFSFPSNHRRETVHYDDGRIVERRIARDVARFNLDHIHCFLAPDAGHLQFVGNTEASFAENIPQCAVETLKFVLFNSPCDWQVRSLVNPTRTKITIRGMPYPFRQTHGFPPIDNRPENADSIWELANCYFLYIKKCRRLSSNAVVEHVDQLIQASGSTPKAYLLALATGVEAILNYVCPLPQPDASFVKVVTKVRRLIKQEREKKAISLSRKEWSRIDRALGALTTKNSGQSAVGKLHALADIGAVNHDAVEAWRTFRNMMVHPGGNAAAERQTPRVLRVINLFFDLIFYTIGWKGHSTDWDATVCSSE